MVVHVAFLVSCIDWCSNSNHHSRLFIMCFPTFYLQMSFNTNRPTNGGSIVQSRTSKGSHPFSSIVQELQCKQGIQDHGPTSDNRMASDHRMTLNEKVSLSCSIVGLLTAKKGDILQIFSNYDGSSLDLSTGSTYFGVLQMTKG